MSAAQTKEPTYYNSCYRHGVDEKRRVQIPAKWRPDKDGTALTLMLWPQHQAGSCLRVLPPTDMAKMKADIAAMPNGNPNKVVLKRCIGLVTVRPTRSKPWRISPLVEMEEAAGMKG